MLHRFVWIKTQFVGFHRWPSAPSNRRYLADTHRHEFKVEVKVRVQNNNRQVEFHNLKDLTEYIIRENLGACFTPMNNMAWSCEYMAEQIIKKLYESEIHDVESVSVSEDGECGATVAFKD